MRKFFVENENVNLEEDKILIVGQDVNHIRNVLRLSLSEKILLCDKLNSKNYISEIEKIENESVSCKIVEEVEGESEGNVELHIYQGLPKADKMELIIQKAVELGAYEIIPVATKRAVVKLDDKKAKKKIERWQQIAESAAKQSKRTLIPEIAMPMSWKEALKKAENLDVVLVPYENERGMEATREVLKSIKPGQSIGVFVGPEGGFAPEEIEQIAPHTEEGKAHRISLGRRILRTETAGLATLSMLIFCLDE